jgi:hypothetical protein
MTKKPKDNTVGPWAKEKLEALGQYLRSDIAISYTPARLRPASGLIREICVGTSHFVRRTPDRAR